MVDFFLRSNNLSSGQRLPLPSGRSGFLTGMLDDSALCQHGTEDIVFGGGHRTVLRELLHDAPVFTQAYGRS